MMGEGGVVLTVEDGMWLAVKLDNIIELIEAERNNDE